MISSPILAQLPTGVPGPCQLDANKNLKTVASTGAASTSPTIVQQQASAATLAGQSYTALFNINGAAGIYPLAIFNPSTAKTMVIYSIKINTGTGGATCFLRVDTANPAFATVVTPLNRLPGGAASLASCSGTSVSQATPTNLLEQYNSGNLVHTFDFMNNGQVYVLPPTANNGLSAFIQTFAAGLSSLVISWFEY